MSTQHRLPTQPLRPATRQESPGLWLGCALLCVALLLPVLLAREPIQQRIVQQRDALQAAYGALLGTPALTENGWGGFGERPDWVGKGNRIGWVRLQTHVQPDASQGQSNWWGARATSQSGHSVSMHVAAQAATSPTHYSDSGKGGDVLVAGTGFHPTSLQVISDSSSIQMETRPDGSLDITSPISASEPTELWAWAQDALPVNGSWKMVLHVGTAPESTVKRAQLALQALGRQNLHLSLLSLLAAALGLGALGLGFRAAQMNSSFSSTPPVEGTSTPKPRQEKRQ